MPGKSRRWHPPQSKKGKGKRSHAVPVDQKQAVAPIYKPVSHPEAPAPPASVPTPAPPPTVVHYPYIVTELRTIGILAGVIVVILVVLALILA